jgi:uncharacterized protein YdeI (YjbR/CyaY-like superfamily)
MGSFGRLTSVNDLPPKKQLVAMIKKAMTLNEAGITVPRAKPVARTLTVPADLKAALAKNKKARATFDEFSPSNQRDYGEWITTAKGSDTRARRLATAIEWMNEGKPRNWKYMRGR